LSPAQLGEKRAALHALCDKQGRDPAGLLIAFRCPIVFSPAERGPMQGTPEQVLEDIAAYRAQGVGHITFDIPQSEPGPLMETLERIGTEILPRVD
jgi:alkanesulfonate monooxygenase SsuD/methylene tetrahydromethanopterin reductase-like flavin-dependent oxidoreductase (luciferase family)